MALSSAISTAFAFRRSVENGDMEHSPTGRTTVVSAVLGDAVIETVYKPAIPETSFAVSRGNSIELVPDWRQGNSIVVPIRPRNNLIRHGALVLPSEPVEFGGVADLIAAVQTYIRRYVLLSEE